MLQRNVTTTRTQGGVTASNIKDEFRTKVMKKPFSRREVFARIERLLDDDGVPRRITPLAASMAAEADTQD